MNDHAGSAKVRNSPSGWAGWWPLIILPAALLAAWRMWGGNWPRWTMMWAVAAVLFGGCKWLTWRRTNKAKAGVRRQIGYWLLWPGLDAEAFLNGAARMRVETPKAREWLVAGGSLGLGVMLYWGGARQWPEGWSLARGWTGMVAFILMAHCGAFHLLSCAWRTRGVPARPLMEWPLAARGVGEFWGRRWNTAFRDLTHRFLFAPLAREWGARRALAAGFFFSGLVHELAITVPAGGGFGGPTLFFTWQGIAILLERSQAGRALGLGRGARGWLFAMLALAAPAGIAFPPVFVERVMLPMMRATGAL